MSAVVLCGQAPGIWRIARKAHECQGRSWWDGEPEPPEHTPEIKPGDRHIEYKGNVYAHRSGPRLCMACATAAGWSA